MLKYVMLMLVLGSTIVASEKHSIEAGIKTRFFNYTEVDQNNNILDTETSTPLNTGGIYGQYSYQLDEFINGSNIIKNSINIYCSLETGFSDYLGSSLADGGSFGSVKSKTFNTFIDINVNIKREKYYENSIRYLYFGLGHTQWIRELSTLQKETYSYEYAQIGVGINRKVNKQTRIGLDLSANLGFNQEMHADFQETQDTNPLDETFKLGWVYSLKVAIPIEIPINKKLSLTTKIEYEYTYYGRSSSIIVNDFIKPTPSTSRLVEPKSDQSNLHLYAGLKYKF